MSARLALVMLAGTLALGCGALRRASIKTVDPVLREHPRLEREPHEGGFRVGPYAIVKERLTEAAVGRTMTNAPEGPTHPGYRYDLQASVRVRETDRIWTARCVGERQASVDADFGAVASEPNDLVAIDCQIFGAGSKWAFTARGRLDGNIAGELDPPQGGTRMKVEIVMWTVRVKVFKRHLPEPVAQVRGTKGAVAAMILSRPEWAWVSPDATTEVREAAMTTLAAIRLLPLGFED